MSMFSVCASNLGATTVMQTCTYFISWIRNPSFDLIPSYATFEYKVVKNCEEVKARQTSASEILFKLPFRDSKIRQRSSQITSSPIGKPLANGRGRSRGGAWRGIAEMSGKRQPCCLFRSVSHLQFKTHVLYGLMLRQRILFFAAILHTSASEERRGKVIVQGSVTMSLGELLHPVTNLSAAYKCKREKSVHANARLLFTHFVLFDDRKSNEASSYAARCIMCHKVRFSHRLNQLQNWSIVGVVVGYWKWGVRGLLAFAPIPSFCIKRRFSSSVLASWTVTIWEEIRRCMATVAEGWESEKIW